MSFRNLKPYAKYGLSILLMICIVSNTYAEESSNVTNNFSKSGGIALSWDDSGHIESCYHFLPIFQKYNATCTINVNQLKTQTEIDELNALHSAGWEVAAHGYNHINSAYFISNSTPLEWLDQEIFPNIKEIAHYNSPVRTLAYPFSSRNAATDAILSPYFQTLRTRAPQIVNGNVNETTLAYYKWDNEQLLYGIEIDDRSSGNLQSIEYGIDRAIKTGTVLVLYGHQITTNVTGPYETSTSRLDSILSYTKSNGGTFYHMGDLGNTSWVPPSSYSNAKANFTVSSNNILTGKSVTFVDYSVNQITEILDFGDGSQTSNTANVTHKYTSPGIYTVNLTVKNEISSNSLLTNIVVSDPSSPVANFSSNLTNGTLPLDISFTDKSTGFPTSWLWEFGDGNKSTNQNPSHMYYNEGTYNVSLTVYNEYGSNSRVATITVQNPSSSDSGSSGESSGSSDESSSGGSSSSSGGSGGGSAGGSPELQSNVEAKELSQTFIASGQVTKFEFTQNATHVIYVNFNSKKTAGKTTAIVEMLKNQSSLTSGSPSDEVYKHLNIWIGSGGYGDSKNIENASVLFKVEKSWIEDKRINKSSITFNRYNNSKWNIIPTILCDEDENYVYFIANTPGFSPFAIKGKSTVFGTIQPASFNKTGFSYVNDTQNKTKDRSDKGTNNGSTAVSSKNTSTVKKEPGSPVKGHTVLPGFEIIYMVLGLIVVSLRKKR